MSQDNELIRQHTLQVVRTFPKETLKMIEDYDPDSLSLTRMTYRAPWDLLVENFRKGTVTVAGDAMHVMVPFLGQGGSAALEDAVVLARNLSKKFLSTATDPRSIEEALDQYIKERRMRIFELSAQSYITGMLDIESTPLLLRFVFNVLRAILFRDAKRHSRYDCGTL